MRHLISCATAVAAMLALAAPALAHGSLIVPTASGFFRGVDFDGMKQWRGIPYAKAPVGHRRLAPPVPTGFLPGIRDATRFGSFCQQPVGFDEEQNIFIVGGSEDCLFLNVTTPGNAHLLSLLPVVVHIHGGGNVFGAGREDPRAFVENGVIVVTFNYRLGALGWMAHPDLSAEQGGHSGNYAMLDQIAVLKWVRANIVFFGGNPFNVTLSGFSAGAFDAQGLAASPLARGLFQKLASQAVSRWAVNDRYNDLDFNERFGGPGIPLWDFPGIQSDVGCAGAADALECMRSVPAERYSVNDYGQWFPETDGYVLPKTPIETIHDNGGTVPTLVGGNREEDAFLLNDPNLPAELDEDDYVALTNEQIVQDGSLPEEAYTPQRLGVLGPRARALYPLSAYPSRKYAYMIMAVDMDKTCPTRMFAQQAGGPVYKYLFTEVIENNPRLAPYLSYHGLDESMLWHEFNGDDWEGYDLSPSEEQLSRRMGRYWTNFARTGNPNGPGLPAWPTYDERHERYLELDDHTVARTGGYHVRECEEVEKILWPEVSRAISR